MAGPALPKWSPGSVGPAPGGDPFAGMYGGGPEQNSSEMDQAQFDALRAPAPPSSMDDQFAAIQQNEDAELQANLAAADARLAEEAARRPPGPGEVLAGQMQGSLGAFGDAAELYARNLPKMGRKYNAAFPFVQQKVAERVDEDPARAAAEYDRAFPFQPEPFQPLPRYEGESDADYNERMQIFADADMRSQMDAYERKKQEWLTTGGRDLAALDTRDIGRTPGAIGMEEANLQGQENVDAARESQDKELALQKEITAEKQADATMAVAQQVDEQRAIEDAAIKARQVYVQTRTDARKALAAMPMRSREQIAKGLSKGTKVAAVLGAIAQGWRGDAITAVNDAIDSAVGDQMDRYERRRAEYGDTVAELDEEMRFIDFLVNSVGGNRQAAAAMLREMHMEDTVADFAAAEARTNVPVQQALYKQGRVQLTDQLRNETAAMELQAAQTPEWVGVTRDSPLMRFKREIAKAQMDNAMKEQMDIRKDERGVAIKDAERVADADVAMRLEGVKAEAGSAKETRTQAQQLAAQHGKDVAKMQAASKILGSFVKKARSGDVAGRGLDAYFATEEGRNVRETIKEGLRRQLRFESQGVIGEDEIEDRVESMSSGWGDNEYIQNAERLINANALELEEREYGIGEEARKIYYRNPNLAPLPARGAGRPSGGADADAEALGGRVVR